MKSTVEQH